MNHGLELSSTLRRCCRKGVQWEEADDLAKVASKVDVLYQTRIQKERFLDRLDDYAEARGKYIIDGELMRILPKHSVVMHPLPRVDEISEEVDVLCVESIFEGVERFLRGSLNEQYLN